MKASRASGRDLGDRELADAERGLELVGRGGLAGGDQVGEGVGAGLETEDAREPGGVGDPRLDDVAEVLAGDPLEELGQHPVGRRRVVLEAGAGLPVQAPAGEGRAAALAGVARGDEQRRAAGSRRCGASPARW